MANSSDSNKNKGQTSEARPKVDLGFNQLISSINKGSVVVTESVSLASPESREGSDPSKQYKALADQSRWEDLRRITESRIGDKEEDGDHEATVWWVKSQIELGGVPISILAAPLDVASKNIVKINELSAVTAVRPQLSNSEFLTTLSKILLTSARKLLATLSDKHALTFLKRACILEPNLIEEVLKLLNQEKSRILKLTGRKSLRDKKVGEIDDLVKELSEYTKKVTLENTTTKQPHPNIQTKSRDGDDIVRLAPEQSVSQEVIKPGNKRLVGYALVLVVISSLILYSAPIIEVVTNKLSTNEAQSSLSQPILETPSIPQVESIDTERVASVSGLDAILYGIDENSKNVISNVNSTQSQGAKLDTVEPERIFENENSNIIPKTDNQKNVSSAEPKKGGPGVIASTQSGRSLPKERVDTTGPIEGTIFYPDLRNRKSPSSSYPGSQSTGRDFFGESSKSDKSQEFKQGKVYRIIAKTRVMSGPSYFAVSMSMLDPGARIEVIERSGEWLKIRSRMGQSGYVLAQDAEPAN